MRRILVAFSLLLLAGPVLAGPSERLRASPTAMQALQERNHASCDTALDLGATTEDEGIRAEHRWTATNYPNSRWTEQALITDCPQGPMDRITLETAVGQRVIFFNIGSFLGHF